jgi:DNA-binding NtrC family response regulator
MTTGARRHPLHARLRAVYPPELTWEISCAVRITIGRLAGASAPLLEHVSIAGRHFAVRYEADHRRHIGRDLGSPAGSRVDGVGFVSTSTPLRDGAVVRLGDVCLVYEVAGEATPATGTIARDVVEAIPGRAPAIGSLRERLIAAAGDDAPVLVEGEHGTGKRRVAEALHRVGARTGPLVILDCASIRPDRLAATLLGPTGATVILDDIGDLGAEAQRELLHALQPPDSGVRIVATTRRPLATTLEEGRLRRDLLASPWHLHVPPLRRRRGDILEWLDRIARRRGDAGRRTPRPRLSPAAAEAILLAAWPDNLHGLERLVDEISALRSDVVRSSDLPAWAGPHRVAAKTRGPTGPEFEAAFVRLHGNVSALARHFSRDRRQIYRWIEMYGLGKDREPS